jgi:hypothetical protein
VRKSNPPINNRKISNYHTKLCLKKDRLKTLKQAL